MKNILLSILIFSSVTLMAQKQPEVCNGLPYAKVDKKASLKSDLETALKKDLPADMKKGEFNATLKCFVSCKGVLESQQQQDGNFSEKQQEWLAGFLTDSKWRAGVKEDTYVTSIVFIQVTIKNGQVAVTIL